MHPLCVDARLIQTSGIGVFLRTVLSGLKSFNPILLCKEEERANLKDFETIPLKSAIYSVAEQWELARKIPRCNLFWSPHFNIPLLPIRAKKRVATIHDLFHLAFFSSLTFPQKCYAVLFFNAALLYSDHVTTVSEFTQKEILHRCPVKTRQLTVIKHGIDLKKFVPRLTETVPYPEPYLLFVGNLKPHKNLYRLVLAFEQLNEKVHLVIVGQKEGFLTREKQVFSHLEKNPHLKKKIHFTGWISDDELVNLYSHAKLLVFPSLYEGFGNPPLEAMACGCPAVASSCASIPEMCGDAVEYVDPYSINSIKEGIQKILQDSKRREELIQKGFSHVKGFSHEKSAAKHCELITTLMKQCA